jgi:hypothetical protein
MTSKMVSRFRGNDGDGVLALFGIFVRFGGYCLYPRHAAISFSAFTN